MSTAAQAVAPDAKANYQQQLCAINSFSLEDVSENRAGRISMGQAKVKSKDSRSRVGKIVGGGFSVALGLLGVFLGLNSSGPIFLIGGIGLAIFGIYQIVKASQKPDTEVASFEGLVTKKSVLRKQSASSGGLVGALASAAVASAMNLRDYYYSCQGGPDI